MARLVCTEEQLSSLMAKVAKLVMQELEGTQNHDTSGPANHPSRQRGRPRSVYTRHLHLRVLPEDAEWFQRTCEEMGLQQGAFMSRIREAYYRQSVDKFD
tara:strand:+ start:539 stop:838 length:300 start_codon:yes stop_codon:yes gene_type:complete